MKKEDTKAKQKKSNSKIYIVTLIICLILIISLHICINSNKLVATIYNKFHLQNHSKSITLQKHKQYKIYIHPIPENLKQCLKSIPCPVCDNLKKLPNYTEDIKEASFFIIPIYGLFKLKLNKDCPNEINAAKEWTKEVKNNPYYQRYLGSDHLFWFNNNNKGTVDATVEILGKESRSIAAGDFRAKEHWPCYNRYVNFKLSPFGTGIMSNNKIIKNQDKKNYEMVERVTNEALVLIDSNKRWECEETFEIPKPNINENNRRLYAYNYRPYYNEKYNILFCAIQKNSNRACTRLMMRMADKNEWNQEDEDEYTNREIVQDAREKYLSVNETDLENLRTLYHGHHSIKAVVVRHPVTRLLSGYLNRIHDLIQYELINWTEDREPSFEEFVDTLFKIENKCNIGTHFMPQVCYCGLGNIEYDFVGHFENLKEESKVFLKSLNLWELYGAFGWGPDGTQSFYESENATFNPEGHKTMANNKIKEYYTKEILDKIKVIYKEDLETFGYRMDEYYDLIS